MTWVDDWDKGGWKGTEHEYFGSGKKDYSANWKRCWEDHKPLKILDGEILGAACAHPQKGYDIYIGLDHGMQFSSKNYPWQKNGGEGPLEFLFPISDMCAPKDVKNFKLMIKWLVVQLKAGKAIQVGCIGGHGRTGLVLAALAQVTGVAPKNAIQWVRKHHCKKAVESASQIKFLMKHYKVSKAEPIKGVVTGHIKGASKGTGYHSSYSKASHRRDAKISAVKSKGSIW